MMRNLSLLIALTALALAGCHPLSQDARTGTDRDLTVAALCADPAAFRGRALVLGGALVHHEQVDGTSLLELMPWRVNRLGEPLYPEETDRRLLVRSPVALDPVTYEPGVLVTFAGRVQGEEAKIRQEQEIRYPLLELIEIHAWDSPFRYGIHRHLDPAEPQYIGNDDQIDRQPYDPSYSVYPYTPYSYRQPRNLLSR